MRCNLESDFRLLLYYLVIYLILFLSNVELTQLIIMVNDDACSKGLTSKPPTNWQRTDRRALEVEISFKIAAKISRINKLRAQRFFKAKYAHGFLIEQYV